MKSKLTWILAALLLCASPLLAAAEKPQADIVLVYWSSKDCKWCTWWESSMSGMEKRFKESPEFKKLKYRVVKNDRLVDPYPRELFAPDIVWVYDLMQQGQKHPGRPGWTLYVNKKRVAVFYGTRDWEEKSVPEIRRIVAEHAS